MWTMQYASLAYGDGRLWLQRSYLNVDASSSVDSCVASNGSSGQSHRGYPFMSSTKKSDFCPPLPLSTCVHKWTAPHITIRPTVFVSCTRLQPMALQNQYEGVETREPAL